MDLSGKTVLITGAAGGIGSALVDVFDKKGSRLILVDVDKKILDKLSDKYKSVLKVYELDLLDPKEIYVLGKRLEKDVESLDVLINCAGTGVYKTVEDLRLEDWNKVINLDLTAVFLVTKESLPFLKKSNESVVVNVGSKCGIKPLEGRIDYNTAKFGLRGFSLSLSKDLKGSSVSAVHVALGSTLTEFGPLTIGDKEKLQREGKNYYTPEFVAKEIVKLLEKDEIKEEVVLNPDKLIQ